MSDLERFDNWESKKSVLRSDRTGWDFEGSYFGGGERRGGERSGW